MLRSNRLVTASLVALSFALSVKTFAETPAELYERVTPSFVAVKFTWDFELRRQELTGPGVVVSEDGLVMCPLGVFNMIIPDAQMGGFKIIVPSLEKDADEIDAVLVGRDERTDLAFLRPKDASGSKSEAKPASDTPQPGTKKGKGKKGKQAAETDAPAAEAQDDPKPLSDAKASSSVRHIWKPIKFEDAALEVGQPLLSVGVLPEAASYKTYILDSKVACLLRGEIPQVLVSGGLSGTGSIAFTQDGKAVGFVNAQTGQSLFLNDRNAAMAAINNPPKFFTPARDLMLSLKDPPIAGEPMSLPWMGIPQMTGLNKDLAEFYGLTNQPAVQVNDVIADTPAERAGLKPQDVIVKVDGKPLERGDEVEELPIIFRRQLIRRKVGDEVTLSIVRKPKEEPQDLTIKLEAQPKPQNLAARYYAEDLGFGVRELVFMDKYSRRMPADASGVLVSLIKPQSNAQSGGLQGNGSGRSDVIISMNGEAVGDLPQFEKAYKTLRESKPKEPVVFVVRREGRDDTVRIEPPQ